jgi:regulator of sigma E protease
MWTILTFVVPALALLTIVVFIHELGHFLVARWCGVRVQTFSIGFGKEICGFNDRHGTRWCLARWPLGGYVRFIDDENAASAPSRDALERLPDDARAHAFQSKPLWQRSAIVLAGPLFNIASAVLILFLAAWLLGTYTASTRVGEVLANSAAERAGLKAGDRIEEIDGRLIERFSDLQRIVMHSPGKLLPFLIERDGRRLRLDIAPELKTRTDPIGNKIEVGVIGIAPAAGTYRRHSFGEAFVHGVQETVHICAEVIKSIPRLPMAIAKVFTLKPQNDIGGPAAIAEMTAHAAKGGIGSFVGWIAIFSVILGIMNLLPIPLLDGGHLMFYALEAIRGRPLDERKQELGFKIGIAIIVTMMSAAFIGDATRIFGRIFGIG